MTTLPIIQHPDPRLSQASRAVEESEFGPELQQLLDSMVETMDSVNGVGLAAVQVGDLRRIAVLRTSLAIFQMVNPRITRQSGSAAISEGCLSFPELLVHIPRSQSITMTWLDSKGETHTGTFEDFDAIAMQHELDHIEGTVILDKSTRDERRAWKRTQPKPPPRPRRSRRDRKSRR